MQLAAFNRGSEQSNLLATVIKPLFLSTFTRPIGSVVVDFVVVVVVVDVFVVCVCVVVVILLLVFMLLLSYCCWCCGCHIFVIGFCHCVVNVVV